MDRVPKAVAAGAGAELKTWRETCGAFQRG